MEAAAPKVIVAVVVALLIWVGSEVSSTSEQLTITSTYQATILKRLDSIEDIVNKRTRDRFTATDAKELKERVKILERAFIRFETRLVRPFVPQVPTPLPE